MKKKKKWDLQKLETRADSCQNKVNEKIMNTKEDDESIESSYNNLKKAGLEAAKTEQRAQQKGSLELLMR